MAQWAAHINAIAGPAHSAITRGLGLAMNRRTWLVPAFKAWNRFVTAKRKDRGKAKEKHGIDTYESRTAHTSLLS